MVLVIIHSSPDQILRLREARVPYLLFPPLYSDLYGVCHAIKAQDIFVQ